MESRIILGLNVEILKMSNVNSKKKLKIILKYVYIWNKVVRL